MNLNVANAACINTVNLEIAGTVSQSSSEGEENPASFRGTSRRHVRAIGQ